MVNIDGDGCWGDDEQIISVISQTELVLDYSAMTICGCVFLHSHMGILAEVDR
jgi:hypothetical protein